MHTDKKESNLNRATGTQGQNENGGKDRRKQENGVSKLIVLLA
jgi:hypothetical protein